MINKEFVPYEQALVLKELGFDEPCVAFYEQSKRLSIGFNWLNEGGKNSNLQECTAPLYQQAFRWFREKHELDSWVYKSRDYAYFYSILKDSRYLSPSIEFTSHEEAELECLKKLIEIVKEK